MIFIDADQQWDENDVLKFLYCDKDVLVGPVPKKQLPISYNCAIYKNEDGSLKKETIVEDRFVEVAYGGTGFMMIKKDVFEKMFEAYPNLSYELHPSLELTPECLEENKHLKHYALFDTSVEKHANGKLMYFGEDYMFCKRYVDIGGKILLDPNVKINHIGNYTFVGDVSKL